MTYNRSRRHSLYAPSSRHDPDLNTPPVRPRSQSVSPEPKFNFDDAPNPYQANSSTQDVNHPSATLATSSTNNPNANPPQIGFEFQTFWPIGVPGKDDDGKPVPVSVSNKAPVFEDHVNGQALWSIKTDHRDQESGEWQGKDGNPIGPSSVMEFITEPFSKDTHSVAMERMKLFLKACEITKGRSASVQEVVDLWKKFLEVRNLPHPEKDPVQPEWLIGHHNEKFEEGMKARPQATFSTSLANVPKLIKNLVQSKYLKDKWKDNKGQEYDLRSPLLSVIKDAESEEIYKKLSSSTQGLAMMASLVSTVQKQGFTKRLPQQKPYHHFMPRMDFHWMFKRLNNDEQAKWKDFVAEKTKTDNGNLYPTAGQNTNRFNTKLSREDVTKNEWYNSIAEPHKFLLDSEITDKIRTELSKKLKIKGINNHKQLTNHLDNEIQKLGKIALKPKNAKKLESQKKLGNFAFHKATWEDDLFEDLPNDVVDTIKPSLPVADIASRMTGEAFGKWSQADEKDPVKQRMAKERIRQAELNPNQHSIFEWRSMKELNSPNDWAQTVADIFGLSEPDQAATNQHDSE